MLNQLQDLGLVEKIIAKPEEFCAISIEEGVSMLLRQRMNKTRELEDKGLKLVQSVKEKLEPLENLKGHGKREFVFIPSRDSAYARSERILKGIKKSIYFVGLTKNMSAWLTQYSTEMEQTLVRGIDCRLILPTSPVDNKIWGPFKKMQNYHNFKVRSIAGAHAAGFSIWDKKEILITTVSAEAPFSAATLWSNNKGLIDLCSDYFNCLWRNAKEIGITE